MIHSLQTAFMDALIPLLFIMIALLVIGIGNRASKKNEEQETKNDWNDIPKSTIPVEDALDAFRRDFSPNHFSVEGGGSRDYRVYASWDQEPAIEGVKSLSVSTSAYAPKLTDALDELAAFAQVTLGIFNDEDEDHDTCYEPGEECDKINS
jgi:hypothetical protein